MNNKEDMGYYLVLTADATEEQARAAFIARYGANPEKVYRMYPNLTMWAGPVPHKEMQPPYIVRTIQDNQGNDWTVKQHIPSKE